MKRIIVLALILLVSVPITMFVTTVIAKATTSIPKIDTISAQILHTKKVEPLGDPIDGVGPPGAK